MQNNISIKKTFNSLNLREILKKSILFLFISISSYFSFSQETIFSENFDSTLPTNFVTGSNGSGNSWNIGVPNGGSGVFTFWWWMWEVGNADPIEDHSISNVVNKVGGQGLNVSNSTQGESGYFNSMIEWAKTPTINCSNYKNILLSFWRWANFSVGDSAIVEISNDNINWIDLQQTPFPTDLQWTEVVIDISSYANEQSQVYIRWKSVSDNSIFYSGWNIDDIKITGNKLGTATWTGSISSDWNTIGNWDINLVPVNINDVIIPAVYNNILTIDNNVSCNNMTLDADVSIVITQNGILNVSNDITLLTNTTNSASLLQYGILNVVGNSIFQDFINTNSWTFISVPLFGVSLDSLNGNVFYWNEPASADNFSRGWYFKIGELIPTHGYDLKLHTGGVIQHNGTSFSTGNYNFTVSNTTGNTIDGFEGWNLIGNPYPCTIDWNKFSISDRNIMGNAIYIWNPLTEIYSTYINGVGINGGTQYIHSGQSFFVKCQTQGTYNITFTDSLKTINSQNQISRLKSSSSLNYLRIKASSNYYSDEIVVRFVETAKVEYDSQYDALKRFSTNKFVPQIYTITNQNDSLSINSLPIISDYTKIPFHFKVGVGGDYSLNFYGITMLDSTSIFLEDVVTGVFININKNPIYNFSVSNAVNIDRFVLHFNMPLTITIEYSNVKCNGDNNGSAKLNIIGGVLPINIDWSNGIYCDSIDSLSPGLYEVRVIDAQNNSITKQFEILEPKSIDFSINKVSPTSANSVDGSIILLINSNIDYNVEWSTGNISDYLFNVGEGNYSFNITDKNGCLVNSDISLKSEENVLNINKYKNNPINIYSYHNKAIIDILSSDILISYVKIFDISGKLISFFSIEGSGKHTIDILNGSGVYIIQVKSNNQTIINKVKIV